MADSEEDPDLLEKEGLHELEACSEEPPSGLIPSFRIWHYPPDGIWVTWVLFVPPEVEPWVSEGIVRQVWWNRPQDFGQKAASPSLGKVEATVGAKDVHRLLGRASRIELSYAFLVRGSPSVTEFGVEGFDSSASPDRLEWDHPVPYDLRTIMTWHSRARATLERCAGAPPGTRF